MPSTGTGRTPRGTTPRRHGQTQRARTRRRLDAYPGRRHIGVAANRKATNAAAWKIHSGQRRGFENHEYEARTIRENGEWHVYARHLKRSRTGRKNGTPDEGTMTSLF